MAEQANPFVQMHYTVNQQSIVLGVGEDIMTLLIQNAQLGIKHAIHVMVGHAAKNVNLLNSIELSADRSVERYRSHFHVDICVQDSIVTSLESKWEVFR